jgi:hypothetical protein
MQSNKKIANSSLILQLNFRSQHPAAHGIRTYVTTKEDIWYLKNNEKLASSPYREVSAISDNKNLREVEKTILLDLETKLNDINFNRVIPSERFFDYFIKESSPDQMPEISNVLFRNFYTGKISIFVFQSSIVKSEFNSILVNSIKNTPKVGFLHEINGEVYHFDGSLSFESLTELLELDPKWLGVFLSAVNSVKLIDYHDLDLLLSILSILSQPSFEINRSFCSSIIVPSIFNQELQCFFLNIPSVFIKDNDYKISENFDKFTLDVSCPSINEGFVDFWEEWRFDGSIDSETFWLMQKHYDKEQIVIFKSLKELAMLSKIEFPFVDWYCYLISKIIYFERSTFDLAYGSMGLSWGLSSNNLKKDPNFDFEYKQNIGRIESVLGYVIPVYYEFEKEEVLTGEELKRREESEKKSAEIRKEIAEIQARARLRRLAKSNSPSLSNNQTTKREYGTSSVITSLALMESLSIRGVSLATIDHLSQLNHGFQPSFNVINYRQEFDPSVFSKRNLYHGDVGHFLAKSRSNLWENFKGAGFRIHDFRALDDLPSGFVNSVNYKAVKGQPEITEKFNTDLRSFFPLSGLRPEEVVLELDSEFDLGLREQIDSILSKGKNVNLILDPTNIQNPVILAESETTQVIFTQLPNEGVFHRGSPAQQEILTKLETSMDIAYKVERSRYEVLIYGQFDDSVVAQDRLRLDEIKRILKLKDDYDLPVVQVPSSPEERERILDVLSHELLKKPQR